MSSRYRRTAGVKITGWDNGAGALALCRKAFAWGTVGTIVLIVPENVLEVGFVRARLFASLRSVPTFLIRIPAAGVLESGGFIGCRWASILIMSIPLSERRSALLTDTNSRRPLQKLLQN